ncbi:MAG: glycosyltransferase [Chryseolinea sp.]
MMTMFFITIFWLYAIFVGLLIVGWNKSSAVVANDDPGFDPFVSIIVAARNESSRIPELLRNLSSQRNVNFEVIVVDDQSEDDTVLVIKAFGKTDQRFKVISNDGTGKKSAITTGVGKATGSIIVTTDADCQVGPSWVHNICTAFGDPRIMMVFGGVRMKGDSFFDKLQKQEFASLMGSAAAAAGLGQPVMCNGANLSFRRTAFLEVEGYQGNMEIASGDDEFLMRKIIARYPDSVCFAHNSQTVVTTVTNSSVNQLLNQRLRWAGKWRKHNGIVSTTIALFVFIFQLSTLIIITLTLFHSINAVICVSLLSVKMMLEFVFLQKVNRFLNIRFNVWAFLTLQLLYPLYVCTIGVLCNFMGFEWKGRPHAKSQRINVRETSN